MNYTDLQVVIKEVCGQSACSRCKKKYLESDINIVGTTKNEAVFMAHCPCGTNAIVNVSVKRKQANITPHERQWDPINNKITLNEVLDMHNFLTNFDGDLQNV